MNKLRIEIEQLPRNTKPWDEFFVSGDFCGWFPDTQKFHKSKNGRYWFEISTPDTELEFKITRGSWESGECKANGMPIKNRIHTFTSKNDIISLTIEAWEDRRHTSTSNVILWREKMKMKPLSRKRNIWVYLPPDYEETEKKYPVIYMHDGQNLFDEYHSFHGEWAVDKTLNQFHKNTNRGFIVVAIENGTKYRTNEYVPWTPDSNSDKYIEFIVNELKPQIDSEFRTLSKREFTAIGGSSYGALISLYATLKYQNIFSKVLAFSPVFFDLEMFFNFVAKTGFQEKIRFYFMAGKKEGEAMTTDLVDTSHFLHCTGFPKNGIFVGIQPEGTHEEWLWRQEFGNAIRWLFKEAWL